MNKVHPLMKSQQQQTWWLICWKTIPKQFDLLLNCSLDQLIMTRNIIDVALAEKLNSVTPVGDSQQENQSWGGKVIDMTKYLN